jgi:hypothetical protein
MPMYLDKAVSDDYLQGLIDGYRDGQKAVGGEAAIEDGDQVVIDRLSANEIKTKGAAEDLGRADATAKG